MSDAIVQPEQFKFEDDGVFPNSALHLLVYRNALGLGNDDSAPAVEKRFAENNWSNSWRNGVYSFAHYHSTSHEVLGVYRGSARLQMGGRLGKSVAVHAGDVIVIPAGVAHQNLDASEDFAVVGAYPDGRDWDVLRGEPGDRPKADENIAVLPLPDKDPLYGPDGPLRQIWKQNRSAD